MKKEASIQGLNDVSVVMKQLSIWTCLQNKTENECEGTEF